MTALFVLACSKPPSPKPLKKSNPGSRQQVNGRPTGVKKRPGSGRVGQHAPTGIPGKTGHGGGAGTAAATATKASSPLEVVKSSVRKGSSVTELKKLRFKEVRVFQVTYSAPADDDSLYGLIVIGSAPRPLGGKEAMKAILDLGMRDALKLARLSSLLLDRSTRVLSLPETDEGRKASVTAPVLKGEFLRYWHVQFATPGGRRLYRSELNLRTLKHEHHSAQELIRAARDQIELALEKLASTSTYDHDYGLKLLVDNCSDTRAAPALAKAARTHKRKDVRQKATRLLFNCHDRASSKLLVAILETDPEPGVRMWAAATLGKLGGLSAIPALEKARFMDKSALSKYAIIRALNRLLKLKHKRGD